MGDVPIPNCLAEMILGAEAGVDPEAYQAFVDYLAINAQPANDVAARIYTKSIVAALNSLIMVVLVLIYVTFVIIVIFLVSRAYVAAWTAVVLLVVGLAVLVLFYVLAMRYALTLSFEISSYFQQALIDTVIYSFNSIFRDFLYLLTCQ